MERYARVTVYSGIGYDRLGGDKYTLAEWMLNGSLRMDVRKSFDLDTLTAGERMIDSEGRYATDFEHDGAWRFRMEMFVMQFTMVTADWFEWKGIIDELHAYTPEQEAEIWAKGYDCERCTEEPHLILGEHYTPPKLKDYHGKFAVVRFGFRDDDD